MEFSQATETGRSRSRARNIGFRAAAIGLGLSLIALLEGVLGVLGLGEPDLHRDPFVGFSATRPLFELDESGERYEISRSRQDQFAPDAFTATKGPREYRIFCIGDSTVQGNPWSIETSFSTWLEISLSEGDPDRDWQVVNCGGISYASYRTVPIVEEVLRYQPDLLVLHCSHNEFLEDRTYQNLKQPNETIRTVHEQVSRLRLYGFMSAAWRSIAGTSGSPGSRPDFRPPGGEENRGPYMMPAEVRALLDYRGGLEFYHHDEAWRRGVVTHFEHNLRRMVALARRARVPILLLNPACQLRDIPPFKAEHRAGLSDAERWRWEELWSSARDQYSQHPQRAIELLHEALAIDDQHAGLHYDLAKCHDRLGEFTLARVEYQCAKELDVCPLRILESMNRIVLAVGRDTGTPVVDVRALFDRLSREGIPGADWFADHVHPTIPGYQRIADAVADEMRRQNLFAPQPGWESRRQAKYDEHFNQLPTRYFLQGQQRLESLMLWANGRAKRERKGKGTEGTKGT